MKHTGIHVPGLKIGKAVKTRIVLEMKPIYRNKSHAIAATKRPKQKYKPVSR